MQTSKQLVRAAGIYPRIKLFTKEEGKSAKSTGVHKVKLIKDKEIKGKDPITGKVVDKIRYLVEENGELKTYDTNKFNKDTGEISYLVQKLAEFDENTIVYLEGKSKGIKNYVDVSLTNNDPIEVEEDDAIIDEEDIDAKFKEM